MSVDASNAFASINTYSSIQSAALLPVVSALAGQLRTHTVHPPHRLSSMGVPIGSGASVSRLDRRMALPYSFVTSRQLFPIHSRWSSVYCIGHIPIFDAFPCMYAKDTVTMPAPPFHTFISQELIRSQPTHFSEIIHKGFL